ncbi:MAG: acyl carrier protein [Magnetococcales bacterium]|nr:acyl carrier protein [Magnetococcales bacterium]NGZ27890.1 acyl carrier protein [Magnetococcales bacterium]
MSHFQPCVVDLEQIAHWLRNWLQNHSSEGQNFVLEGDANFLQAKIIDSFQLIELISAIEEEFGFQFNFDQLQDPRFPTVNGLSQLLFEGLSP